MRERKSLPIEKRPYYQAFLSFRYLRSRASGLAAVLSMAFGVAIIVIVLSIMGGYMEELREQIRGQESHIMIVGMSPYSITRLPQLEQIVASNANVVASAPFIETLAMYRSAKFSPCQLRGILPSQQVGVSSIGKYVFRPEELLGVLRTLGIEQGPEDVQAGELNQSGRPTATRFIAGILGDPQRPALSGQELESLFDKDFRVRLLQERNPSVLADLRGNIPPACIVGIHLLLDREMFLGQVLTTVTLDAQTSQPVPRKFVITGAFRTGDYDVDSKGIYVHVDALKNLLGLFDLRTNSYRYEGLRVSIRDTEKLGETRAALAEALAASGIEAYRDLRVLTWEDLRGNMLSAVYIEKFIIYFLLLFVVSFTACMVFLMLFLTVIEKTRDVGILMALGTTPSGIVKIFLTNGIVLSAAGTVLGLILGYLFCIYINPIHDWIYETTGFRLFPAEIYHMDRIPTQFSFWDVLLSVTPPIVLGFLASILPARWAAKRDPIKAIHYE